MEEKKFSDMLEVAAGQKEKEKEYWLDKLSGELLQSHFPYNYNYKKMSTPLPNSVKSNFSRDLCLKLMKLSGESDYTLHMILTAGLAILMARYTDHDDIIMGTSIFNQDIDTTFINTLLPIRIQFEKNITFKKLLLQVRTTIVEAMENYSYPIEILLDELGFPLCEDNSPLFDAALLLENIQDKKYLQPVNFNMIFSFSRIDECIELNLEYNSSLYTRPFAERVAAHFQCLFQVVLSDLKKELTTVDILSEEEKKEQLYEFNNTSTSYPRDKTIQILFEEQVEKSPDKIALAGKYEGTENSYVTAVTYRELNKRSNQLARVLQAKGVEADKIIGLMLPRSIEMIVCILAILKAGGAYLPIGVDEPEKRVRYMLEDSNSPLLLTRNSIIKDHFFPGLQGIKLPDNSNHIHRTGTREQIRDLDNLPIPDRSLINYEKYQRYIGLGLVKHSMSLQGTRGCPYNCAYCHKIWPKKHYFRSAENIFSEVRRYYDMGVRRFSFIDDIFNLDVKNSSKFFQLIIKNNMDVDFIFPAGLRGDILTKEYIDLMVEAGTINHALALETASPRLQKLIGKNLNIEKLRENAQYICKKHPHVLIDIFTMHGFPTETEEEAMMTLDFLRDLKKVHFPSIAILKIYPNTDMERIAIENGISRQAILRSENLAFHQLPDTLPFDKSFTIKYQTDFLDTIFLSKERLLNVLPYQMKALSEDEIVQKYNSYLPTEIHSLSDLLTLVGIQKSELGVEKCLDEDAVSVIDLNSKLKKAFPSKETDDNALRVILLDVSQTFSSDIGNMLYDVVEAPLGLMYLLTCLDRQYGPRIKGKIAKSRFDFDSFEELKSLLDDFKPELIGIRTLNYYKDFFHRTIALIKHWGFDVPIITGGPYATSDYERILQDRNVDLVVLGEGEVTFNQLIGKFMENNRKMPEEEVLKEIPGLVFVPQKEKQKNEYSREIIIMDELSRLLARESGQNVESATQRGHLAYTMFTSGSTGQPKAVLVNHQNVVRLAKNTNFITLKQEDNFLQTAPLEFDASTIEVWGSLLNGLSLFVTSENNILNPEELKKLITKNKISIMWMTSPLFNQMLETDIEIFSGLENIMIGGDILSPTHINQLKNRYPDLNIINGYGPTENTTFSTTFLINKKCTDNIPIGKPISNSTAYILDNQNHLVPVGVPGELYVGGDGVSRGYLNNPELSYEKFIPNYCMENDRLYKTGDMARWLPDGNIDFLGRMDHQIKMRGIRIELGEIESQLLNHEDIKKTVVVAIGDDMEDKYLCAYIVPVAVDANSGLSGRDKKLQVSELREFLSKNLPKYMIPSFFITLEKLPLTHNGKLDKKALPDPKARVRGEYPPLSNETEKVLAKIWTEVLGIQGIGASDDFYEIGGDSIKSIQITARLHKAGYKAEISDIFMYPTIAELAPKLKKIESTADQTVVTGVVPFTPIQKWFFHKNFTHHHHFNHAVMLFIREGMDEEAAKAVFARLQEHHDALRMTYKRKTVNETEEILQINQGLEHPLSLEVFDFRNCENAMKMLKSRANEIQANIHLGNGPLMKLGLFHLDDGDRLLIVIHHLIIDTVSWRILAEDLENLYQQYKQGKELSLPLKTNSFKRWAEKQSQYANTPSFLKEKNYWKQLELTDIPRIKKDFEEEENIFADATKLSFTLSEEETGKLLTRVNEAFATEINDILLTALGFAARESFGYDRLLVALEGHGREKILEDVDVSRTVGWFTSLFPVLLDMTYTHDLSRQIKEIKENIRQVPNKGIGYGILKYVTAEEYKEDIQFKPEPQISFNYLGQFDTDLKQMASFKMAKESPGNAVSPKVQRAFQLDITGLITNSCLEMSIIYNRKQYKTETIQTLVEHYKTALQHIIDFCCSQKSRQLTPGDLSYKQLSIETLEQLQKNYDLEDLYPLAPLQEGMLFHSLYQVDTRTDFCQISYRFHGDFEWDWVEKSLKELSGRHDILRTAFMHEGLTRPLQVVVKDRQLGFYREDIRKKKEKENYIEEFKEKDKNNTFDLARDVLMRVAVLQTDDDSYEFIWSFHHILMDGWCVGILQSEFFKIYRSYLENSPLQLPSVKPYRTYIQWLEDRDKSEPGAYWQTYLQDYDETASILKRKSPMEEYLINCVSAEVGRENTERLKQLAVQNRVTLNNVMQTIWAIVLARHSGKEDVVFGAVVSGRPSELKEVETIAGLFINTIPVRIRLNRETRFNQLVRQVQEDYMKSENHHYYPLAEIQSNSILKNNLFDHVIVFENFPLEIPAECEQEQNENDQEAKWKISKLELFDQMNYDFSLDIIPRDRLNIRFNFNEKFYMEEVIEKVAFHTMRVIEQVINNGEITIGEIELLSEEEKNRFLERYIGEDHTLEKNFEDVPVNQTGDQEIGIEFDF
ncbi:MAG: amino acid adenylation domain-containing protein [Candidatus Aminicenantes bacterium]|jgi:amino acid adenylation domain-containing protein/non-ribosomal peptide synthase protein (TIGR01720 family)